MRDVVFSFVFALLTIVMLGSGIYFLASPSTSTNAGLLFLLGATVYGFVTQGHIRTSIRKRAKH